MDLILKLGAIKNQSSKRITTVISREAVAKMWV